MGGIHIIKGDLSIPYPAFPPYDVRPLHPGIRPTRLTYMLNSAEAQKIKGIYMYKCKHHAYALRSQYDLKRERVALPSVCIVPERAPLRLKYTYNYVHI